MNITGTLRSLLSRLRHHHRLSVDGMPTARGPQPIPGDSTAVSPHQLGPDHTERASLGFTSNRHQGPQITDAAIDELPDHLTVELGPRRRNGWYFNGQDHYRVFDIFRNRDGSWDLFVQWKKDGRVEQLSSAWRPYDDAVVRHPDGTLGIGHWNVTPREGVAALISRQKITGAIIAISFLLTLLSITLSPANITTLPGGILAFASLVAIGCLWTQGLKMALIGQRLCDQPDAALDIKSGDVIGRAVNRHRQPAERAISNALTKQNRRRDEQWTQRFATDQEGPR